MTVRRTRGKQPGWAAGVARRQLHDVVCGRELRLLGRAIRRVPPGAVLNRMDKDENKQWDAHTGLFLRRHTGQPVIVESEVA